MGLFVKRKDTGEVVKISKYTLSGEGEESIWSHEWYGRHVLGIHCEWCVGDTIPSTESKCNKHIVNSSTLTELESKLLLPLIEKRRLEIEDYTVEFHELGHTIEKLKEVTD